MSSWSVPKTWCLRAGCARCVPEVPGSRYAQALKDIATHVGARFFGTAIGMGVPQ